ncbi:MAG: methyltransferase domain-containing protein [Xanthobacteraceae bacterium]
MDDRLTRNYPANYDAHARSVPAGAYWRQVRRTINGKPVDETQIMMIVNEIERALILKREDVVLDLACGNGALSSYLFNKCAGVVGVDISPYLIEIARRDFARPPNYCFSEADMVSYVTRESEVSSITKALIYGAFQYVSREDAVAVLRALNERFSSLTRVFIGNLPDRRMAERFYGDRESTEVEELNDPEARIGVWYVPEELAAMAEAAGWRMSYSSMSAEFYASAYRFDLTLSRSE